MSASRSTGSPTQHRQGTPSSKTAQVDENIKVGKEDYSVAAVSDQLKSLLVFVSAIMINLVTTTSSSTA